MTHVVGKPAPSSQRLNQLGQYANSPGHRGLAVTQNSTFSSIATTRCAYLWRMARLSWAGWLVVQLWTVQVFPVCWCVADLWMCLMLAGVDSQAVSVHAEADRLRRPGWGHRHCAVAQQSLAAGEAHHVVGDRHFCRSCPHQARTTVLLLMLSSLSLHTVYIGWLSFAKT